MWILFCINVRADTYLGSISVWETLNNSIGRWNADSLTVGHQKLNNNTSFPFAGSMANGTVKWTSALNVMISIVSGITSADIPAYGGSTAQLVSKGFSVSDNEAGRCKVTGYLEGYWYFGTSAKAGNIIVASSVGIVDYSSSWGVNEYTCVATHELGHALGWLGHSFYPGDIMWESFNGVTTLQTAEKLHLSQIY